MSATKTPPCDAGLLHDLNSGNPILSSSDDIQCFPSLENNDQQQDLIQTAEEQQDLIQTEEDEWSDGTWAPSIDGEDTDDEVDLEDNAGIWQEVPLRFDDFSMSFNNVDSDLEFGHREEVKESKKRVL